MELCTKKECSQILDAEPRLDVHQCRLCCGSQMLPPEVILSSPQNLTCREAIVPHTNYPVAFIYDASANLCGWILAPHSRKHRNAHEVIVPSEKVLPRPHGTSPCLLAGTLTHLLAKEGGRERTTSFNAFFRIREERLLGHPTNETNTRKSHIENKNHW